MTSIVQRVALQALRTFRNPPRGLEPPSIPFLEQLSRLQSLLADVRAADLRLSPPTGRAALGGPPVSYMHIAETESFSLGVFLLRAGAGIPLHDHPGMRGLLRVLYGTLRVSCYDLPGPPVEPPGARTGALRRSVLRSSGLYTELSPPCLLSPDRDNLHRIEAVDGPAAFMDILAPPYDPEHGRDCHYYRVLGDQEDRGQDKEQGLKEVWLMEVPQPIDFWCGAEPYPGPKVRI